MTSSVGRMPADDRDDLVALIAAEQARPDRHIPSLGVEAAGIAAELAEFEPDWATTARVAHDEAGLVGAALVDWDTELGRAWVHGPWITGDDDRWARWARPLVDAVLAQLPAGVDDVELSGDVRHERLAALAAELGWAASEINWVTNVSAERATEWDDDRDPGVVVRPARADDLAAIAPLHDAEFPATYLPAARLLAEAATGPRSALVALGCDGAVVGYASGTVQADGDGYLDFVAVDPVARGHGAGRALVTAVVREVLPATTTGRVNLTVQDHRAPARALYDRLGFVTELGMVGYRSR